MAGYTHEAMPSPIRRTLYLAAAFLVPGLWAGALLASAAGPEEWLLIDRAELQRRAVRGPAWRALEAASREDASEPNLSDQDDPTNVIVLAKALVAARRGDVQLRKEVVFAVETLVKERTEAGGRTLALGRELAAYVLAADLIDLDGPIDREFRAFLKDVRTVQLGGRTLISTHRDRPNNWGTHAGASRIAVALYLDDRQELEDAADVLRGYLGDRAAYSGFKYGDLHWQGERGRPVGVNAVGAEIDGHSVDGVLADDQRRAGAFAWPPPTTGYAWEALQGLLLQAILLERAGFDPFEWSDRALLRAARWLIVDASFPPTGDEVWQLAVLRRFYPQPGFELPEAVTTDPGRAKPGKGFGFSEFLYPAD